jgi:hypothetical protein
VWKIPCTLDRFAVAQKFATGMRQILFKKDSSCRQKQAQEDTTPDGLLSLPAATQQKALTLFILSAEGT